MRTRRSHVRRSDERGMTLIELLIVVAIIGILSAIAAFNYLSALDKAKQKRTISDIRAIAMAWETYATENSSYNPAGVVSIPTETATYDEMSSALIPNYTQRLPEIDGWGNPLVFNFDLNDYSIRSLGKDGTEDESYDDPDLGDFKTDIVFSAGTFVLLPTGRN